jgi:dihydroneopterin aldolase
MSDEQQTRARHYREIALRIRELARQARIAEIEKQLFDLADRLDELAADDVSLDKQ